MTTTTNKDKPGKMLSKTDNKKTLNMPSMEHRSRMRGKLLALGKERGYKEGHLDGAIIWFSDGTPF